MSRIRGECDICGETLIVECDVSHDEDSRLGFRADYYSRCPNVCAKCGEHFGYCECDKEESNERRDNRHDAFLAQSKKGDKAC
jgi:hypothetical protein